MTNRNIKERKVMDFEKFKESYDNARKAVKLKDGDKAHPGAHDIKGEDLYVRNDANPYQAAGIPHDEDKANVNPKYMNANQVDVFHNKKMSAAEKKKAEDLFQNQVVAHHQMAVILDESVKHNLDDEFNKEEFEKVSANEAKESIEFTIPEWAVGPLVNGDYSGLEDEDEEKLNKFVDKIVKQYGNAHFMPASDEEIDLGFCHSNDIDKLGNTCYKLLLIPN